MKSFLPPIPNRNSNDRQSDWACLLTNLLVLPGMGSIAAGKNIGYLQATLAIMGGLLTIAFMARLYQLWFQLADMTLDFETLVPALLLGLGGIGLFLVAWVGSLITSLKIMRQSKSKVVPQPPIYLPPRS